MSALKIPYDQLNPETLHGIFEEFVTRDGTDYGEIEVSLETKISQVLSQLKQLEEIPYAATLLKRFGNLVLQP
jgi:uncharacterized protein YheU (UPF0270 family)